MNQVTQDNEIKCECQLRDLVKSIEFHSETFGELETDNRKIEERNNELEEKARNTN